MESENSTLNPITPTLIKGLASSNSSIRSKTLNTLFNSLPSLTLISDTDLKKLWKSLFYCVWHSDKVLNQTQLIQRLSSLILTLSPPLSLSYFSQFFRTMRREWQGIDHLRLDKFYLLVRYFVRDMFNLMKNMNWVLVSLEEFVAVLEKDLFFYVSDTIAGEDGGERVDNFAGNGVCYQVVSVYCEEMKPFLPLRLDVLNVLFRPFFGVLSRSDNKVLVAKVESHVFGLLLKNGKGLIEAKKSGGGEVEEKSEVVLFGTVALAVGFSTRFYELGSSDECVQGNRKVMLRLHEEFARLEKEGAALGIEVALPDAGDDEVPELVPINAYEEADVSENGVEMNGVTEGEKKSKKCKKENKEVKEKKSKKKKKKKCVANDTASEESNGDTEMVTIGDTSNLVAEDGVDELVVNEDVISNLQKQFEKIAAESGLESDCVSVIDASPVSGNVKVPKKRKRSKSAVKADTGRKDDGEQAEPNTEGRSVKRVRFAMKDNLVWKTNSPLPPQSARIPPSSTPRGSALKKGVSPGPIRDSSQDVKKAKKKKPSPLKKAKKVKSISAAGKRKKKAKSMPAVMT